ncbi:hypothetical protein [Haloimpatiens massiliensis]|uniref:hypothetical protein n=1 Tax=Haloimpatiens massiliensis TaxID=1658110 RepID=UPI000C849620|nr:hypothetical protein [Haloimpatiens massiliensis]
MAYIHFLVKDKVYTEGDLNNVEYENNGIIENINIGRNTVKNGEMYWKIWVKGVKCNMRIKSFKFLKNGKLYILLIYDVVRSVLAPNRFLLNRIVEMDNLENYFTYDIEEERINIHFTFLYSNKLRASDKINQLSWIISNSAIFTMFSRIGYELRINQEVKFDFLFKDLNLKANVN